MSDVPAIAPASSPDAWFRAALEECSFAVAIWRVGSEAARDIRLLHANPAALAEAPFDLGPCVGQTLEQAFPRDVVRGPGPKALLRVALSGVPEHVAELRHVGAEGVEAFYRVDLLPLAERVVASIFVNITREAEARRACAQNEQLWRAVFDHSGDIIAIVNPDGTLQRLNRAATPTTPAAVVGIPITELVEDAERPALSEAIQTALRDGGASLTVRGRITKSWFHCDLRRVQIVDDIRLLVVARDITEQKRDEQLRVRFLEHLIAAEDEFRRSLVRELHDETSSALSAVLMGLGSIRMVSSANKVRTLAAELESIVQQASRELARISRGLNPSVLEDFGLGLALQRQGEQLALVHGMVAQLELDELDTPPLPRRVRTTVYRIVQEALTNAARHAHATRVNVAVRRTDDGLSIAIRDDGQGFDPNLLYEMVGLGLIGIRERAALLGGRLEIVSAPGRGTTLRVELPASTLRE